MLPETFEHSLMEMLKNVRSEETVKIFWKFLKISLQKGF